MSQIDLKPCPFCGGRAEIMQRHIVGAFQAMCQRCNAAAKLMPSKMEAAALWNRRTGSATETPGADYDLLMHYKVLRELYCVACEKVRASHGKLCLIAMAHRDGDVSMGLHPYSEEEEEEHD